MPNPFVRSGPSNVSKGRRYADDPDSARPTGMVDPIPEGRVGHNHAYRGIENHGVDPNNKEIGRPDEWADSAVVYDPPPDDGPAPIAVRIVREDRTEVIRTRILRGYAPNVGQNASQLIGGDWEQRRRIRVKVKNLDAAVVYIGPDTNSANAMSGWPLAQNEVLEVQSHEPLWAAGSISTGTPQAIAVYVEYSQPFDETPGFSYGRAE